SFCTSRRRTPKAPLFPYTTLFRSQNNSGKEKVVIYGAGYTGHQLALSLQNTRFYVIGFVDDNASLHGTVLANKKVHSPELIARRSEEHTSELQSRENLVCRLLLEK